MMALSQNIPAQSKKIVPNNTNLRLQYDRKKERTLLYAYLQLYIAI